jgi:Helicase conserved C-terminal domain
MGKAKSFDTIWREKFDPVVIDVPKEEYRDFTPVVHVIPFSVHDPQVFSADERLTAIFAEAIQLISVIVKSVPPRGVSIPTLQLIRQLPEILSKRSSFLRVFAGRRIVKEIPVSSALLEDCRNLQRVMLERLLLFEDLEGTIPDSEVDRWASANAQGLRSLAHAFVKRTKLTTLVGLLGAVAEKQTVIFVRNVPVCEGIFEHLRSKGLRVSFAHGEVADEERLRSVQAFKRGDSQVLVVTRQLFGRGFDLPQAEQAIFYSPKDSPHTMWQEMLRIRSTLRKIKTCFVLFYAWTAEARKMNRLLERILKTGGALHEFYVRWSYSEVEDNVPADEAPAQDQEGAAEFDTKPRSEAKVGATAAEATRGFVVQLLDSISAFLRKNRDQILKSLQMAAEKTGFLKAWPRELLEILFRDLAATLETAAFSEPQKAKKFLAYVFHPDKHPTATAVEKDFWHELFVALEA